MSNRTYPRKVWVLQPSFKPVEVMIVEKYKTWGNEDWGDLTEKSKRYLPKDMFDSKEAAIKEGRARCVLMQADLDKRTDNLCKKIAALDKAEKKS